MPHILLVPHEFSVRDIGAVRDFECGNAPWEVVVASWIKGPVLDSIHKYHNRVWLYLTPNGELVGFGSLGHTRWRIPRTVDPHATISIIPMLGVQTQFQGQPSDVSRADRFSSQIMDHLQHESVAHDTDYLALEVHEQNARAIKFYESYGFSMLPDPQEKRFDGQIQVYRRMAIRKRRPPQP